MLVLFAEGLIANMIYADIVIIDSGVDYLNPLIKPYFQFDGINLSKQNSCDELMDSIGHGTAVYYLINKYSPESKLFIIKIFEKNLKRHLSIYTMLCYMFMKMLRVKLFT
jgi:hypothetical protein